MENLKHVYTAIASVQGDLAKVGISKDQQNKQQHFSYRGIDDIYRELSKLLSKYGLCILPRVLGREVTERKTQKGGVLFCVVVDVEYDLVCSEDGSTHTVKVFGEAMDSADKATNKAMSAAYKYACLQMFCIPTEGDNDADGTTHKVEPKQEKESEDLKGFRINMNACKTLDALLNWYDNYKDMVNDDLNAIEKGTIRAEYSHLKNKLEQAEGAK